MFLGRPAAPQPGANFAGGISWLRYTGEWNPAAQLVPGAPRVQGRLGGRSVLADADRVVGYDEGIFPQWTVHEFYVPELSVSVAPAVVSAGDTLRVALRGGVPGHAFVLFVVTVNGTSFSRPVLQGVFGNTGEFEISGVLPASPLFPGNSAELQAWTRTDCGLTTTLPAPVSFQ